MGIFSAPKVPVNTAPLPEPRKDIDPGLDPNTVEARKNAARRREQLAKQVGRRQLRIDLNTGSSGSGIQTGE